MNLTMPTQTMTSREIAELVDSNHADVRRSIERLAERGAITLPPTAEVSNPGPGPKTIPVYLIGKRDSYIIVAQLSPEFTARLVDRWQELEQRQLSPANLSRMQLIEMAMQAEQERLTLEDKVGQLAPKAEALDLIATKGQGSMCITDTAKTLQLQPKAMFEWLSRNGWIYRRVGNTSWCAYQDKLQRGLLEHKVTTVSQPDGGERVVIQVAVTPKGLTVLAGQFSCEGLM